MLTRMLSLCTLLVLSLVAQAATDIFLRVDGIPGDSMDARHRNEIVLNSYSFGVAQPTGAVGNRVAGRSTIMPLVVTKNVDSSSPRFALASLRGEHIKQVYLTVRRPGQQQFEFLHITLSDVVVSGFTQENSPQGVLPTETIQLTFAVIEMEFIPQRPDGSAGTPVRMRWDLVRNMAG